ncbi:hypothetical protein Bpro_0022 [Polaromonas sp. JS666]|nr:hypothetical protein Bpro_0022 [Polaromonas sp. JS666]
MLRQEKVSKEKATRSLGPLRCATGQPAVLEANGVSLELAALRQSRALIRLPLRSSAQLGRVGANTEYLKKNQYKQGRATECLCGLRSWVFEFGVWLLAFLSPTPSVCAEERRARRIRDRDCLSEVQRSEFERDPAWPEHRRLPVAKRRDADSRVAFSFAYFSLGEAKEK